ncbi:TPA: fimbria/pilus outer membrane usher protein [Escherichia coli]|nr:fimbria/pilus outer membrane usher protein [Escherichia coli]
MVWKETGHLMFYSKRGQEQISISQQLGNYGTTFFSASRQSYWNTSRSDQQISFGLNVPFGDITTSLNYSYSNNIWQNDRDHLLAFTLNVPFSHWMRTDSQSAFRNSNASYSMSNDLKGGMTNLSGVYGTLLPDNNLNYSVQVGNTHGGNTSSGTSGYSSLNYRGAYGNTNVGYSRSGDSSQIYYGMSGGIIAHADGITFGQPLGDTMVLVKAPGADNVKIENQTGIHTDWRGYAILPFATEYRENRVALNANSLADNVELDETVVTVIPTHGAIARATFNAQIGGKVCTGQARALICMGGNFALAMPDREASAVPLTQLDLAVHVATKLNRSHLLTARHSYILPVLGRSEIDMQKNGAQAVTVEDSMSMIHASRGVLKPAGVMLKSECAVVAGIAQAALPQSVVAWEYLVEDYDRIRNDIEAVLPEFADYNQRIRHPGGFHLINAAAERRWMTPSGKANFITSKGLLEDPSSAFNSKLVMATVRSHDQYNTTIYGMDDRYRGVFGQRDVVFMSAKQAKICRVKNGERVNLIALTPDGKRSSRRMDRLKVVIYPMADRSLVTYFPESNHMLTLDNHDPLSGIPGYKSIPVELEPSN